MFGGFEQAKDEKARKRWFASAGTSLVVYGIVGVGLLVLARQTVAKPKEEPPIDVSFHAAPDVPEVKTEAPPPPPPPTNRPRVKRPGKAAPTSPQKIPDARPDETTPTEVGPKDDGQRKWIWGRYNAPTWKKAGLAASAALTVVSLGVAIGTYVMIKPNGKLYNDLIDAANNSQTDENDDNNIDPHTRDDLCTLARAQSGGEVKNAEMTKICNKADGLASASTAAFIATGVFAASTLVFTTLLFVHKNKPGVARLRHHGVTMGMAPTRGGGVMLGGSLRF